MLVTFEMTETDRHALGRYSASDPDIKQLCDKITRVAKCNSSAERDQLALKMHEQEGKSYTEIGNHFGISRERARQIVIRAKRRQKFTESRKQDPPAYLQCLIDSAEEIGCTYTICTRAFNCLMRAKVIDVDNPNNTRVLTISDEELLSISGFGIACLELVRDANKRYEKALNDAKSDNNSDVVPHVDLPADATVQDVIDSMTEEQKQVVYFMIGRALDGAKGSDEVLYADLPAHVIVQDVIDSMTEQQKRVMYFMVGKALKYRRRY